MSKINVLLWKKAVLHTTTLMQCKAGQVLRDLFSPDQGNGSDMTYVSGTTKINLKNLKTWRYQLRKMWTFDKFWQKSYLSLSLKALKSSSHISAINWLKIFLTHVITYSYVSQCCFQSSNLTSLKWWCWSSLSLPCFLIFIHCFWLTEF